MEFLDTRHHRAILLLASGRSAKETAVEIGVSTRCIELWKNDPDFRHLLKESSTKAYEASHAELMLHTQQAVFQLKQILDDAETPTRLRLSAIQIMLQHGLKLTKETTLSKIDSLDSEEIINYFLQHGDDEQIFKALEYRRKIQETAQKNSDKIPLENFQKLIEVTVGCVKKYLPKEKLDDFKRELGEILSEAEATSVK